MIVEFNKGYICSICKYRFVKKDACVVYKNSCICNKCYSEFDVSNHSFVFQNTKETEFVMAPFTYNDTFKKVFHRFKFNGDYASGQLLGMLNETFFRNVTLLDGFDCIIPVPLSKKRFLERGYNQTEILSEYVGKAFELPICKSLIRTRHTAAQSSLVGQSRIDNVSNAFKAEENLNGKNVLLFDDIVTTGSTVNECSRVLKAAGAQRVGVLCSARVMRTEQNYGYINNY